MDLENLFQEMNQTMENPDAFAPPKSSGFEADARFYKISKDKDGSGSVKIRFLPSLNGAKNKLNTFVTRQHHTPTQYKTIAGEKKKRFIDEICPKTADKSADCPICDYAWDNWKRVSKEAGKEAAKSFLAFTPKSKYISNIQILEDKENPENEGKIFLFEYGEQIQKLIKTQSQPTSEEVEDKGMVPFNAWDVLTGKDFRLKLQSGKFTENGFPSWESSFFVKDASKHVDNMEETKALLEKTICLDEFLDETHIKSNDELIKQLNYVRFIEPEEKKGATKASDKVEDKSALAEPDKVEDMMKSADVPFDMEEVKDPIKEKDTLKTPSTVADVEDFFAQFA